MVTKSEERTTKIIKKNHFSVVVVKIEYQSVAEWHEN